MRLVGMLEQVFLPTQHAVRRSLALDAVRTPPPRRLEDRFANERGVQWIKD
jgi:hypothetical protein